MAALELGTEEGVLVAVFCDGVVETDGEEDGTKDEEGEGGELGVGVAITLRRTPAAVGTTFVAVAQGHVRVRERRGMAQAAADSGKRDLRGGGLRYVWGGG